MPYDWTDEYNKGDKVQVTNNSVMKKLYNLSIVTGTIFFIHNTDGFALKCTETGRIQMIIWGDGEIEKI